MRKVATYLLLAILHFQCLTTQAQIGSWKAHLAYHDVKQVEKAGNTLYVLASNNLYAYNTKEQSVQTFSKMDVLSDCNINYISWCPTAQKLLIVYKNYNIDVLDKGSTVQNISDYYSKQLTDDKTINDVYISGNHAYLSTGFGIVNINVAQAEITNTYNLGFPVRYCYIDGQYIYAASSRKGTYRALLTSNLLDPNNWTYSKPYTAKATQDQSSLIAEIDSVSIEGPLNNNFGFMRFQDNKLYTVGGGYATGQYELKRPDVVQVYDGDNWLFYEHDLTEKCGHTVIDFLSCSVDPKKPGHVFVGARTGVFEFQDGAFVQEYNIDNTFLGSATSPAKPTYCIVPSTLYDAEGNLWLLNSSTSEANLVKVGSDNQWTNLQIPAFNYEDGTSWFYMTNLMEDSRKLLWFVNNHWTTSALACYQPSTGGHKTYTSFVNQDGTTVAVNGVRCVAEDFDHNIWIGTNVGPLYLSSEAIAEGSDIFTQVKVARNDGTNLADYLLTGLDIRCMAIDGAGRKWFGTATNGLYLISADNTTQEAHFTRDNSPLLSNTIESLAINDKTGEVFIGTDEGLCSYMSDATEASESMSDNSLYAYPNPVRPDYSGLITIVGLSYDADVKIVTSNGVLVAQGRSTGGTFTWDGRDLDGKRVAGGVYMVQTATQSGGKGAVCKIAIVR